MKGVIRLCNHKGDAIVAEFDPTTEAGVQVAQAELTRFLEECIAKHGIKPPVWHRRINETDYKFFRTSRENDKVALLDPVNDVEEFVLQYPLVGG